MSVPEGTLSDEWRTKVLDFYGELFGWEELEMLRLPDRLTIAVGSEYINVRERPEAASYTGYEHFGVTVESADAARRIWDIADARGDVKLTPFNQSDDGFVSYRLEYLLPLAVEVQHFPTPGA